MQKKPVVFAIDDEEDQLELLVEALGDKLDIHTFQDPIQALEALDSQETNLIVTDIMMPHMDGVTMISKIRSKQLSTPVLVVSGYSNRQQIFEIYKLGCLDFITKPFRFQELTQKIFNLLSNHQNGQDNFRVELAKELVQAIIENGELTFYFSSDSLSDNGLSPLIRQQLYAQKNLDTIQKITLEMNAIKKISTDNLVTLRSFIHYLSTKNICYSIITKSKSTKILLEAEFKTSGEAI